MPLFPPPPSVHGLRRSIHTDAWRRSGAISETLSRSGISAGNLAALSSQQIQAQGGAEIDVGTTISSVTWMSRTTPLAVGTNQWMGVVDSSRNVLALTADDTVTAWAASTEKTLFVARTVTDAAMASGTATLTSATAAFTTADTGRQAIVIGAGAAGVPLGSSASPVTMTFVNATTVTLSSNAGTTVSGVIAYIATPVVSTVSGGVYLILLVNAVTPPSLMGVGSDSSLTSLVPVLGGRSSSSGLTTPATCPSPIGAITGATSQAYAYYS